MAGSCASPPPTPGESLARRRTLLAGVIIVLAALAAYHNSFSGPFILDDVAATTDNPSIRHLGSALSPPSVSGVGGRPFLNLTYALNYALGGTEVWGYHAFNLIIHMLAGLTLFGLVRRTLTSRLIARRSEISNRRFEVPEATLLALAVAVLWVVHPLQTEAVTYVSQRAESVMALFYLLTLYCFIRSQESGDRSQEKRSGFRPLASSLWSLASIFACLLGVLTKETIITAPVMVFLYDRTFVAGSFREAWRLRWRYYLGLAGTWLPLAGLMAGLHHREVGFGQGVTWWSYALTSCRSVVLYLKLAIWPNPLVFDYGAEVIHNTAGILPCVLVVVVFLAGLVIALRRWPAIGFAGAWFFVILAPTTSLVPIAQEPTADHRVYLSLAAVIGLVVLGLYTWIGRRSLIVFAAMAVGLGWLSVRRNEDYRSEVAIWNDTVVKCPGNSRACYNLGNELEKIPHQTSEAISAYEAALRINHDYAEADNNLGIALANLPGRLPDAMAHFEEAIRIKPDYAEAHNNLALVLAGIPGRLPDAISEYEAALRIDPNFARAHYNLGLALANTPGRLSEAIAEYEAALRINPNYQQAHTHLGMLLANTPGRLPEAVRHFAAALQLAPDSPEAQENLRFARQMLEKSQNAGGAH